MCYAHILNVTALTKENSYSEKISPERKSIEKQQQPNTYSFISKYMLE